MSVFNCQTAVRLTCRRAKSIPDLIRRRVAGRFALRLPLEGACGTQGVSPRPRRHGHCIAHGDLCRSKGQPPPVGPGNGRAAGQGSPPRKQDNACVPHTTVLSACNSQRGHGLGLLTERLARHVAGSLGRPPRVRVVVLSLLCGRAPQVSTPSARKARTRDGVRRIPLRAGDETGVL